MTKDLIGDNQKRTRYSRCALFTYATVDHIKLTYETHTQRWEECPVRFTPDGGELIPDSAVLLLGIPLAYT
jgi:hypothetical protein